jgi:hypothetical protein
VVAEANEQMKQNLEQFPRQSRPQHLHEKTNFKVAFVVVGGFLENNNIYIYVNYAYVMFQSLYCSSSDRYHQE